MSYGQNDMLPLNLTYTTTCNLLFLRCKKLYSPKNVYDHMLHTIYCSLQHIWAFLSQFQPVATQLRFNWKKQKTKNKKTKKPVFVVAVPIFRACHIWQPVAVVVAVQKRKKPDLTGF